MKVEKDGKHDTRLETEIVKVDQELAATEKIIQEDLGEFVDDPDSQQKTILIQLGRLHLSLRGPERLLDQDGYSRAIPPRSTSTRPTSGK
jgi:hypothetical protein